MTEETLRRIQRHDALVWPQQFWKSSANGSNIVLITEQKKCWELLAQKFDQFQTSCSSSEKHAITYNSVEANSTGNTQHCGVVGHSRLLHPFARSLMVIINLGNKRQRKVRTSQQECMLYKALYFT